ncbi:hypothetical protein [Undibacterium sp. TS12]|uniref:hypothetical protein n=1 Tax=Undibacterium sp. TS12 TaxID=2908202 RepID=UPI001F4CAD3E|nr:hypothetical protein [Undibacterium sp. TS12]MCH8621055.1 hypothetical protein [Undibacterium sp. TS12]
MALTNKTRIIASGWRYLPALACTLGMALLLPYPACAGGLSDLGKAAEALKAATGKPAQAPNGMVAAKPGTLGQLASPADYQGLPGEAVVTATPSSSFDEASKKIMASVQDGDPVYFHVRLPRSLKDYVFPTFSDDRVGLILSVGPRGQPGQQHNAMALLLTNAEMEATELHLNLAPGEVRKSAMLAWMETVGGGSPGHWENEIRLLGKNRSMLAVAPLTAEVSNGISKYRAMIKEYGNRFMIGDPASNEAPLNIHRRDARLSEEVVRQASQLLGRKPEATYFTDDGWSDHRNGIGQIEYQITTATLLTQLNKKPYYQNLSVRKYPVNGRIEVELDGKPRELTMDNYKRAMAEAR